MKRVCVHMHFPVTRDPKNNNEIVWLDISQVVSIQTWERSVIFHTLDGEYYPVLPKISTLEKHLDDFGFRRLDRSNLVHLRKIQSYDEERSVVFFEEPVTPGSKYSTVSHGERTLVKKELANWKQLGTKRQQKQQEGG